MTNNDVFKKLRVALSLRNDDIQNILKLVDYEITLSQLNAFFRKEDDPKYRNCGDQVLRNFLNGLVIHMRGPAPADKAQAHKPKGKRVYKEPDEAPKPKKRNHDRSDRTDRSDRSDRTESSGGFFDKNKIERRED